MREPRLKMARETEIQKKIPDRVLNSYRSPTTIAAVNAIHRRNEFLAIQTQDRIKVDAS
ncbi:MAG: hypothetical protein HAW66_02090 [Shewanella sp.]|nr:hypothetical protein [Shewanella sp.]